MDARILKEEFSRAGPVQRRLHYTAAALYPGTFHPDGADGDFNRLYSIDQQLCRWLLPHRWLLLSLDRLFPCFTSIAE
jgi:hypothetical protein